MEISHVRGRTRVLGIAQVSENPCHEECTNREMEGTRMCMSLRP